MPLRGDSSAAIGHRYEGRYTARALLEVLREEAQAIRLQPPGPDGAGVEFYVRYADRTVYHQVKRQRTLLGDWSVAALSQAGVLQPFLTHLSSPEAHCTFASAHSSSSLEELSEHARSALSWDEYEAWFLSSKPIKAEFAALKAHWKLDDAGMLDHLRRVWVDTIGEESLRRAAMSSAETILQGDQGNALAVLVEVALDNVNRYLTAQELWDQLAPGYKASIWKRPQQAAIQVDAANTSYIDSRRATLIHGELIPRVEADKLASATTSNRLVLVDGAAGMGKSDVLHQFARQLKENGMPFLAFRLDRVSPCRRPSELGAELELPSSPQATLAAVAQGRECILLIDQLDAVSATSGRNPQFLECIEEVVRAAYALPNIRIVLVCRTFDVQNDARLRQLVELGKDNTTVTVGPFERVQLEAPLTRMGYGKGSLSHAQLELLRVPLHLALLAGSTNAHERLLSFSTPLDLFDAFWRQKRRDIDQGFGTSSWEPVIRTLVDYMSDGQMLRAPHTLVDAWEPYAEAMISANVLSRDGAQLAFFHESFFDYSFARSFVGRSNIPALLAKDQFLFRRGQVRQILAHERAGTPAQYAKDLRFLIQDESVRFHLKDLVTRWLSSIAPTSLEWGLIEPLLLDAATPLHETAWLALHSVHWFKLADSRSFVTDRLLPESPFFVRMLNVLSSVGSSIPERVAELLAPFIDQEDWWDRIGTVVSNSNVGESRKMFDLLLRWVERWDPKRNVEHSASVFGHTFGELVKLRPDWGCELLGQFIRSRMEFATRAGFKTPFDDDAALIPTGLHIELFVGNLGAKAPIAFLDYVWPHILQVIQSTSVLEEDRLHADPIWRLRHFDHRQDFEGFLLDGAEAAFAYVARNEPARFDALLAQHRETDYETVVYLLYEAFRAAPERLADLGIQFALADKRRFRVGFANGPYSEMRRLIEALSPHLAADVLAQLETALLGYFPRKGPTYDKAQFTLLSGIVEARRSPEVRKRLGELERKYDADDISPPDVTMRSISSPIGKDAARKMTDENWLQAIAKHTGSWRDHAWSHELKGGAEELSRVLAEEANAAPERFARLALRIPDNAPTPYFEAILSGVGNAKKPPSLESIVPLIEKCHALKDHPCGHSIVEPLRKQATHKLPRSVLEAVGWYALHDPDPSSDREESDLHRDDLISHGLNCVRGRVASGISELIEGNPAEHLEPLLVAVRSLVSDPVTAVRAMAAEIVCALVRTHEDLAQELFLLLVEDEDDRLLITNAVHHYLLWQGADDFAELRPVMERMISSRRDKVRQLGSAQINLAALSCNEARASADKCLGSEDEALRLGAADVFASNLVTPRHTARCEAGLGQLFGDAAPAVRKMAASALWRLKGTELGNHVELARAFLRSPGFSGNADRVLHALRDTTASVPELILETCEATLNAFEASREGPLGHQASQAIELVLRAYADSEDRGSKERALDLVDRALRLRIYGTQKALSEHDRGFS